MDAGMQSRHERFEREAQLREALRAEREARRRTGSVVTVARDLLIAIGFLALVVKWPFLLIVFAIVFVWWLARGV